MYYLYLFYKDFRIGKYKCTIDDIDLIYEDVGKNMILDGFQKGYNIDKQIEKYKIFMEQLHKQKINCEKIRASDIYLYLSSFMALYKLNNDLDETDYFFLKLR